MKSNKTYPWGFYRARSPYLLLTAITAVAFGLRFYKLGEWSFWIDEILTLRLAERNKAVLQSLPYSSLQEFVVQPSNLLMQIVLGLWGTTEWTARLAPALIGVISVPILYLLVKQIAGSTVALVGALLLAISPWHLYLSQNARYYSALILFYMLTLLIFYIGTKPVQYKYLVLALVFLVLGILERLFALFLVPIVTGYLVLVELLSFNRSTRVGLRWVIFSILLLAGAYLVYDAFTVLTMQAPLRLSVFKALLYFSGKQNMQPQWLLTSLVNAVGVPLFCIGLYGSVVQLRKQNDFSLLLTLGAWLPLIILMVLTLFIRMRTWYLLIVLPCWVILGALGVQALYHQAKAGRLLPVYSLLALIVLLLQVDPFLKDLGYYLSGSSLLAAASWTSVALLLAVTMHSRLQSPGQEYIRVSAPDHAPNVAIPAATWHKLRRQVALGGCALAIFFLIAHPLVRIHLYYTFQHGLRDEMQRASAVIQEQKLQGDVVLVHPTLVWLAEYYLNEPAYGVAEWETLIAAHQRVWLIEEFGVNAMLDTTIGKWAATNCRLVHEFDRHVEGRIWPMRVQLCE